MKTREKQPRAPLLWDRSGPRASRFELRPELDRQTRFQEVLHEHHWNARTKTINALADPVSPGLHAAARRMAACGRGASFFIDPDKERVRPWLSRCGHRLCPFCGNARSASSTEDLTAIMLEHHAERMIILTVRSHDLPLDMQIISLLQAFKRLRARSVWKRYVTGGVYVLEITMNAKTGLWHPHLHVLVKGTYFPQAELAKHWREITDGSNIVWTSKINDIPGAARELAKYIGKPQRVADLEPHQIREYARAVKSVRMIQTFGDLHGKRPKDVDEKTPEPRSDERVRLSTLIHLARSGHAEAVVLLTWLARRYQVFGRYVHHEMPQLIPDPGGHDKAREMLAIIRGEPRPSRDWPEDELTEDELDHKICQAFTCYIAGLRGGRFRHVKWYHKTETENLNSPFDDEK